MAAFSDELLYQTIKELDVIPERELNQAAQSAKEQQKSLGNILVDQDLISDENLGKVVADLVGIPFIRLTNVAIPDDILHIIPEVVAQKQRIIAFRKDTKGLHVATSTPENHEIMNFLEKKTGLPVVVYFATTHDIENGLALYAKDVTKAFADIIAENVQQAKGSVRAEPPIIKIVDTILTYAYQNKASDVHIEPLRTQSLIRFRIDGILHDIVRLPLELHPRIITRIKVMARLRTDEHQAAQDGKLKQQIGGEELDVRVSILPITNGEKSVMRLLSERSRQFSLADLGFAKEDLAKVEKSYKKPYGMIFSSGPTGSGKTTTMYAVLKLLNKREVNIATIEDPVEYEMQGVNQIQVNTKTNLTFANGLRSILRQDPDIILVGEVRDEETAGIAINAAMTGHLVLSTLHTNDAATAIPRLIDMNVEPYLVASSVNVIIAQRLVRKIHSLCRVSQEIDIREFEKQLGAGILSKAFGQGKRGSHLVRMYTGKGCKLCHGTGYEGRVGIFEVLVIDDDIRQAIVTHKDASVIKKIATANGMKTMLEDGLEKIKHGATTLEEILRVTKE